MTYKQNNGKECAVAKKCGACQLSNMDYERQLRYKQAVVVKLLRRFCRVENIIGMETPYHYRNKAQYTVRYVRRRILTGIYQSSTKGIAATDSCFLNDKKANMIAKYLREQLALLHVRVFDPKSGKGSLRHFMIRSAAATGEYMVVLVSALPQLEHEAELAEALRKKFPEIKTIVLNISRSGKMTFGAQSRVLYGSGAVEDVLCGKRFLISPKSFYQINPVQTEILYRTAIDFAGLTGDERVLDAYCGIGTIGIAASDKARSIVGVELNADAVRDAKENARLNGVENAGYICADAAEYMKTAAQSGERFDVVFTDPPRAGCSAVFLSSLVELSPERVVYVSCEPQTLARDLQFLTKNGYRVRKIQPVDMFPHTRHVETVVLLRRKNIDDHLEFTWTDEEFGTKKGTLS